MSDETQVASEADGVIDVVEGEEGAEEVVDTGAGEGEGAADDDNEMVISIGDEELPQDQEAGAPEWVRELRRNNAANKKRIKELEDQIAQGSIKVKPALGEKPTLEGCDYDAEQFEQRLTAWWEEKRAADREAEDARKRQADAEKSWQDSIARYERAKSELKVADYDSAEESARELFDETQRGIVIHAADNPALLTYAMSKDRARAEKLAAIKDPVQFAFAVAKLEVQLKVTNRKSSAPPPEKAVKGSGSLAAATDGTLDRLRAEAEKSGDYSKVMQYKRQQRAKA